MEVLWGGDIVVMKVVFNRWKHIQAYSWPFRVFKQYYEELNGMYWANYASGKYIYKSMASNGYTWDSKPNEVLDLPEDKYNFSTLRNWSNLYNSSFVWQRLNLLMSLSSILETYMSAICSLAIESNPGVLINSSKSVDGVRYLKQKKTVRPLGDDHIVAITKGEWNKRIAVFQKLFGNLPDASIKDLPVLESLRKVRNQIGHSYGRDISKSRSFEIKDKLPLNGVSDENLLKYFSVVYKFAVCVDKLLMDNHIGEYQTILLYHNFYFQMHPVGVPSERANSFRKYHGKNYYPYVTKSFCLDLVNYYHSL